MPAKAQAGRARKIKQFEDTTEFLRGVWATIPARIEAGLIPEKESTQFMSEGHPLLVALEEATRKKTLPDSATLKTAIDWINRFRLFTSKKGQPN
jgi:hypothetical protein